MTMQYMPGKRENELQLRMESPEYVASRKREADMWRHARMRFGADEARRQWRHLRRSMRALAAAWTDALWYAPLDAMPLGLGRLLPHEELPDE